MCRQRREEEEAAGAEPTAEEERWLDEILTRYVAKVRAERRHRLAGEIVAADYTLRQLTHIELILDVGGRSQDLITLWTGTGIYGRERFASEISERLEAIRRDTWRNAGEPPRPPLRMPRKCPGTWLAGSPNWQEREKARLAAERRMAEAQAEWEAAQREDSWAEWVSSRRVSEA